MADMFESQGAQAGAEPEAQVASEPEQGSKELAKVRAEAARYRTERNALKAQVAEVEALRARLAEQDEAEKTEAQKLTDRVAQLEAEKAQATQAAAQAAAETSLMRLAAKAGLSPDVVPFLRVDKFDLDDEDATLAQLKAMGLPVTAGGGPSNPGGQDQGPDTPRSLAEALLNTKKSYIFGG